LKSKIQHSGKEEMHVIISLVADYPAMAFGFAGTRPFCGVRRRPGVARAAADRIAAIVWQSQLIVTSWSVPAIPWRS
jgi:hypothetical protein